MDSLKEFFAMLGHMLAMSFFISAIMLGFMIALKIFDWYQSISFGVFQVIAFPMMTITFLVVALAPSLGLSVLLSLFCKLAGRNQSKNP
jgi:hypothetical protein